MNGDEEKTRIGFSDRDPAHRDHQMALDFLSQHEGGSSRHFTSLLAEYVTGIPLEKYSELVESMLIDKGKIRQRYGLPSEELKASNSSRYIELLKEIAEQNDLRILPENRRPDSNNTVALANGPMYDDISHTIYVNEGRGPTSWEHELVHGLEDRFNEGMTVERMEYEAYLCGINSRTFADPDWQVDAVGIFWGVIAATSLEAYYQDFGLDNPWIKR